MDAALAVRDLEKRYGRTEALRGIDLEVGPGEMLGLLGPNGAGKSTLTKIACGLVRPTGGSARVLGQVAGSAEARRQTGYLAELFRFPTWASADELLSLHQRLAGSGGGASERSELLELVGLGDAARTRIGAMSKGMQQRLGLAQALIGSPRLLLLDEPTSALDPAGRRIVRQVLIELRQRGVSALINSHLLTEVERTCDRVAILSGGLVVAGGTPDELSHARGVEIVTAAGARRFEDAQRERIPEIVAELVAAGERIYEVRPLGSSLEDAYLEVLGESAE
jgi:ABC-2 type transport system ATP-binding protein